MELRDLSVSNIHRTAVVHPKAQIASGVTISPFAVIGEHVSIGEGTIIHPHVVIDGWTTVGKNCEIFPGASIGAIPQDLKFDGEKSYVVIGDNNSIRECVTINRATGEGEETKIGSNVLIMAYAHVAHNCIVGNNVIMANLVTLAGHVQLEDRAVIGGLTGVHQFVKIGRNAMIGGASRISQDIPPFITVNGNPPTVNGLNSLGLARAGISPEVRKNIKQAYKILYRSNLTLQEAIQTMEQDLDSSEEIEHFLRFLRNVERGICR